MNLKNFINILVNNGAVFQVFDIITMYEAANLVLWAWYTDAAYTHDSLCACFLVFDYYKRLIISRVENRYLWNRYARIIINKRLLFIRTALFLTKKPLKKLTIILQETDNLTY